MQKVNSLVLKGFHPDPSLLRVGGDYYLATSTFEWFPGVRIYHSNDLVNWTYLTSPLDSIHLLELRGVAGSDGIWAPCLSYSNGYFYLIYTVTHSARVYDTMDTPNYLTRSKSILGPWEEPVFINASGFDPSLFHDDDGRKYLINMEWNYRNVKKGNPFSGIIIQEYDAEKRELIGKPNKIFTGTQIGSLEGPHIYKHNGYYYLFCAEGGTGFKHAETVARSKNLLGPYEVHPKNPLITSDGKNSTLKKAGHVSICDTPDGKWYLAHLCARVTKELKCCVLGRETAIQNMEWHDNWPVLSSGGNEPLNYYEIVDNICLNEEPKKRIYHFLTEDFRIDFQTLRIPYDEKFFSTQERKGFLRIRGRESIFSRFYQSLIARRQTDFCFEASTSFEFHPYSFQHSAGLNYRYDEDHQYYLYATYDEERKENRIELATVISGKFNIVESVSYPNSNFTFLLKVNENNVQFYYKDNEKEYKIGNVLKAEVLSDEVAGGFTGAFVGISVQDLQAHKNYADFSEFIYATLN